MTADRKWMEKLGFELEDKGSMVPLWVVVDDCGGERPASLAEVVLWTSLTAPAATVAPAGDKPATSEPVAVVDSWTNGSYWRNYNLTWLRDVPEGTKLYTAPPDVQRDAERDVIAERRRQVAVEGWTPEHDDEHGDGSMSIAAACYALADRPALEVQTVKLNALWLWTGWAQSWFKPRDQRSNLVRAGALILAEIERLDRAAAPVAPGSLRDKAYPVAAPVAPAEPFRHIRFFKDRDECRGVVYPAVISDAERAHVISMGDQLIPVHLAPVARAEPTHLHRADGTLSGVFIEPAASEAAAVAAELRNWFDFLPGHAQPTIELAVRLLETRP